MRIRRASGAVLVGLLAVAAACAHPDVTVSPVEPEAGGTPIQVGTWWQTTNPGGGGAFSSPVMSPDGVWAVATALSGMAMSFDEGATWWRVGATQGLSTTHVSTLLALPDGRFLAGSNEGLWSIASDGSFAEPLSGFPTDEYVTAMALGPGGSPLWVASHGTFDGLAPEVYRSDDGGATFATVGLLPAQARVTALRTHPSDPDRVLALSGWSRFVADGAAAAWVSVDGGETWDPVAPDGTQVVDAALDPHRAGVVWFTETTGRLWRTVDGGAPAPVATHGGLLWLDPVEPGRIRLVEPGSAVPGLPGAEADPSGAVWDSPDDGITWIQRSTEGAWSAGWSQAPWRFDVSAQGLGQSLAVGADSAVWVTSQGVLAALDGGRSVTSVVTTLTEQATFTSRGLDDVVALDVAVAPGNPDVVYGGYQDLGCWRSMDGGDSWSSCNPAEFTGGWGTDGGTVTALAVDPVRSDRVWMAVGESLEGQRVVRSDDFGASWSPVDGLADSAVVSGITVDPWSPEDDRVVYAAADGDIYRSDDGGSSFEAVHECLGCRRVWAGPGFVLAGGESGLWVSRSGLEGWRPVSLPGVGTGAVSGPPWMRDWVGVSGLAVDPADPDRWWVAVTGLGLFTTGDAGAAWVQVTTDRWIRDVLTPGDGSVWTASSSATVSGGYAPDSRGVLVSPDGGQTWSQHIESLAWPLALSLDQVVGGPMWVATAGEGLARRRDDPPPAAGGGFIG